MTLDTYEESEIHQLVHDFYDDIRVHAVLGPIFNKHIEDWDHHLAIMVDFWSSLLCRSARYSGSPMMKHARLPELSAELFCAWLAQFEISTARHPNQQLARHAHEFSKRIARSLWMGYQIDKNPDQPPLELNCGESCA